MKKILLVLCIPIFFFGNMQAADNRSETSVLNSQELSEAEAAPSDDALTIKTKTLTKKSDSKLKRFFKRLNPFKKMQGDFTNYFIAFLLGLLLGIIGILIAFLIYLNHENRKGIMKFAWIGWLWWLVIFSILLL